MAEAFPVWSAGMVVAMPDLPAVGTAPPKPGGDPVKTHDGRHRALVGRSGCSVHLTPQAARGLIVGGRLRPDYLKKWLSTRFDLQATKDCSHDVS